MIKHLKHITVQLLAGANAATVTAMLLVGFSDRLDPTVHPLLSTVGMTFPFFLLFNLLFLILWIAFKWKMAVLPVAGYVLAFIPINIYMPLNPMHSSTDGDSIVKVVSYNVCAYGGNYKYDDGFERVRSYLADQHPDIVCLQEDVDTWRRNVFDRYKPTFEYNDTVMLVETAASSNAIGIHTRFPIIRRERISYSSLSNGSAAWWLLVGGDTLIVVNNHFESCHLNSDDRRQYREMLHGNMERDSMRQESQLLLIKLAEANEKRAPQIRAVRDYVRRHSRYRTIVCGDFNDNPISYSRHTMSDGLTDCFVSAGNGIGLSFSQRAFSLRIDHMFCSPSLTPLRCIIDSEMDASDHYPLVCWLKMGRKT